MQFVTCLLFIRDSWRPPFRWQRLDPCKRQGLLVQWADGMQWAYRSWISLPANDLKTGQTEEPRPDAMPDTSTLQLLDQVSADIGVIRKAWEAAEGNHPQQGQVAAAALAYVLTQTPALLQVFNADAALAPQSGNPQDSLL
jgi:hypothetical protein